MARRRKRSPEREAAVLNALRLGNTRRAAAAYAEVSPDTFYVWLADPTFRDAVEKAEADAETRFLGQVARAAADGTWTAAAWWLERRKYQDYARRDKVEMTIDVRKEAERLAAELGLDAAEVLAEAEAIMRGGR
jgi:hypothetical protein